MRSESGQEPWYGCKDEKWTDIKVIFVYFQKELDTLLC